MSPFLGGVYHVEIAKIIVINAGFTITRVTLIILKYLGLGGP
jgi:hypothetical protein